MKHSCGSAGQAADHSEECSAGQPAYQTSHVTAEEPHHYCSIYASKPQAHLWKNVLVPTCGKTCYKKRCRLLGITIGDEGYNDIGISAVRPVVAVRNTATHISSSDGKNTMVGDALMLHDIFLILGQSLLPQCLLRLSAGSRTLHRYATSDDVCKVFMHGSLLRDFLTSLTPSISVAEDLMPKTLIT